MLQRCARDTPGGGWKAGGRAKENQLHCVGMGWDILGVLVSLQFLSFITDKQVLDLQEKVQDPALASKRLSKSEMP